VPALKGFIYIYCVKVYVVSRNMLCYSLCCVIVYVVLRYKLCSGIFTDYVYKLFKVYVLNKYIRLLSISSYKCMLCYSICVA
jgi:hypothetical protein